MGLLNDVFSNLDANAAATQAYQAGNLSNESAEIRNKQAQVDLDHSKKMNPRLVEEADIKLSTLRANLAQLELTNPSLARMISAQADVMEQAKRQGIRDEQRDLWDLTLDGMNQAVLTGMKPEGVALPPMAGDTAPAAGGVSPQVGIAAAQAPTPNAAVPTPPPPASTPANVAIPPMSDNMPAPRAIRGYDEGFDRPSATHIGGPARLGGNKSEADQVVNPDWRSGGPSDLQGTSGIMPNYDKDGNEISDWEAAMQPREGGVEPKPTYDSLGEPINSSNPYPVERDRVQVDLSGLPDVVIPPEGMDLEGNPSTEASVGKLGTYPLPDGTVAHSRAEQAMRMKVMTDSILDKGRYNNALTGLQSSEFYNKHNFGELSARVGVLGSQAQIHSIKLANGYVMIEQALMDSGLTGLTKNTEAMTTLVKAVMENKVANLELANLPTAFAQRLKAAALNLQTLGANLEQIRSATGVNNAQAAALRMEEMVKATAKSAGGFLDPKTAATYAKMRTDGMAAISTASPILQKLKEDGATPEQIQAQELVVSRGIKMIQDADSYQAVSSWLMRPDVIFMKKLRELQAADPKKTPQQLVAETMKLVPGSVAPNGAAARVASGKPFDFEAGPAEMTAALTAATTGTGAVTANPEEKVEDYVANNEPPHRVSNLKELERISGQKLAQLPQSLTGQVKAIPNVNPYRVNDMLQGYRIYQKAQASATKQSNWDTRDLPGPIKGAARTAKGAWDYATRRDGKVRLPREPGNIAGETWGTPATEGKPLSYTGPSRTSSTKSRGKGRRNAAIPK